MNTSNAAPVLADLLTEAKLHVRQALELLVSNKAKISALGVGQSIGLTKNNIGITLYVNNNSGLCDYLSKYRIHYNLANSATLRTVFRDTLAEWEHYTGSPLYPIPMCKEYTSKLDAVEQYDHCLDNESNMYYHGNEYGQLRWEAIEYVIKTLANQAELSNQ